jgi:hypothetical protein
MVWYLMASVGLLLIGLILFRCGINFKGGAGAPGSIIMLAGMAVMLVSVFVFGMAVGVAIAAPTVALME